MNLAHREGIREYLKNVEVHGLVLDVGIGTKPIEKYLKPNDAEFIGIDKLDHVEADYVIDLEQPQPVMWQADFAFCIEVLEHIWNSRTLLNTIYFNLKNGGYLYLSQPYQYLTHKEDDRIRYTHHGLKQLLEEIGFLVEDIRPTQNIVNPTQDDFNTAWGFVLKARRP